MEDVNVMENAKDWTLKALTDVWTGDTNRQPDRLIPTGLLGSIRLIPTGLLGSIRWWFEVLVRGLGGHACDPTAPDNRCSDQRGHHCVVCELFGCTGWARKFRLMVVDESGQVIQSQIQASHTFVLRLIPLRPVCEEEWCLLDATLRLIADYGAIGGKTVLKPTEEWGIADLGADDLDDSSGQVRVHRSRQGLPLQVNDVILGVDGTSVARFSDLKTLLGTRSHGEPLKIKVRRSHGAQQEINVWAGKRHHQDFGLITIEKRPQGIDCTLQQARTYVQQECWRKSFNDQSVSWASLQNFWCVKGRYLARQDGDRSSFNFVIGIPEPKNQPAQGDSWLAGKRPNRQRRIEPESKKVFSFKYPEDARRTFGFVKPGTVDFDKMKDRLQQVWHDFNQDSEFLTVDHILKEILP